MIDITKKYRTCKGLAVTILHTSRKTQYEYTVVGLVHQVDEDMIQLWRSDGTVFKCEGGVSDLDLIEVSPYEDWPIDAPIWVRNTPESELWIPRHFAGVDPNGYPLFWPDGFTSHTYPLNNKIRGIEAHLAWEFTQ